MRHKFRLFIGWFGILTPAYAAGVLTAMYTLGQPDLQFVGQVVGVSILNLVIGRKVLKQMSAEKVGNKPHSARGD